MADIKQWLIAVTEPTIVIIDALALILIVLGTVEAFAKGLRAMLSSPSGHAAREIWLRYGRWLVAALTFQLAADILETSITESWEAIGRIAAIAVIRTFLNYFLESDLAEIRERQRERHPGDAAPTRQPSESYKGTR
jgi:uncharacterized membrane protein